jgi:hypothetical protein
VALPPCSRCGKTNPRKMIGLMTLWFGPFVDMRPDHGYFYLCPACYRDRIKPHLDVVQGRLAELHPLARHLGLHVDPVEQDVDQEDQDGRDDLSPETTGSGSSAPRVAAGGSSPS